MLTKTDLSQIRKVVREEVEEEGKNTKNELQAEIKLTRMEIQSEQINIKDRLKNLEIAAKKIQKTVDTIIDFFDRQNLNIRKRVERIEESLGLSPLQ